MRRVTPKLLVAILLYSSPLLLVEGLDYWLSPVTFWEKLAALVVLAAVLAIYSFVAWPIADDVRRGE